MICVHCRQIRRHKHETRVTALHGRKMICVHCRQIRRHETRETALHRPKVICPRCRQIRRHETRETALHRPKVICPNSPSATRYSFSIGIHHVTLWTAFLFSYHVPVFIFSSSSFFLHVHHLFQSLSMYRGRQYKVTTR